MGVGVGFWIEQRSEVNRLGFHTQERPRVKCQYSVVHLLGVVYCRHPLLGVVHLGASWQPRFSCFFCKQVFLERHLNISQKLFSLFRSFLSPMRLLGSFKARKMSTSWTQRTLKPLSLSLFPFKLFFLFSFSKGSGSTFLLTFPDVLR